MGGRPLVLYLAHITAAVVAAGVLFVMQPSLLSGQFDGAYTYVRMANLFRWQPADDPFGGYVPHEGTGGRMSPHVFQLLPHLLPFWVTDDPVIRVWAMYVILAGLLAVASLAYFRAAGVSRGSALAASWLYLVIALTLPDLGRAVPHVLYAQFSLLAALTAFAYAGRAGVGWNVLAAAGFALVTISALLANLNFTAYVAGPVGALAGAAHVLACRTFAEIRWKLGVLLLTGGLILALGIPGWLSLLGAGTSRLVFFDEIIPQPQYAHNAGMIFRPLDAFTIVYALAIVGVVGELLLTDGRRRVFGGLMAVLGVGVGAAGAVWLLTDYAWRGPAPAYINVACFPWLALAAVRGIEHLRCWLPASIPSRRGTASRASLAGFAGLVCGGGFLLSKVFAGTASAWAILVLAVVVAGARASRLISPSREHLPWLLLYPTVIVLVLFSGDALNLDVLRSGAWGQPNGVQRLARSTPPFAELLHERLAIAPGLPFRGYADSYQESPQIPALTPPELMEWHLRDIPTISQYSLYILPAYYAVMTRLLAAPEHHPNVNHVAITRLNLRLLRLMGLRLLVSNVLLDHPGLSLVSTEGDRLLYELEHPNLGTYSPTQQHRVPDAAAALAVLGQPTFDPQREFVTIGDDGVADDLVPAAASDLTIMAGGYRFRAHSDATSLIVVPMQYSRCLELIDPVGIRQPVRAVRVNLVQTGILFTGAVDVAARVRFGGPWERCLGQDVAEIDRLRLRDLVQPYRLPAYSLPGPRLRVFAPLGLD